MNVQLMDSLYAALMEVGNIYNTCIIKRLH